MLYQVLLGLTIMGTALVPYTRARAEILIPKCNVGIMERPERILLIFFGAAISFDHARDDLDSGHFHQSYGDPANLLHLAPGEKFGAGRSGFGVKNSLAISAFLILNSSTLNSLRGWGGTMESGEEKKGFTIRDRRTATQPTETGKEEQKKTEGPSGGPGKVEKKAGNGDRKRNSISRRLISLPSSFL